MVQNWQVRHGEQELDGSYVSDARKVQPRGQLDASVWYPEPLQVQDPSTSSVMVEELTLGGLMVG